MKDPEIDPLAPELRALLGAERAPAAPSAEGKARVAARLDALLLAPGGPGGSGGPGGAGGSGDSGGPSGSGAPAVSSGAAGSGGARGAAPAAPLAPPSVAPMAGVTRMVAVFVAGAITGGALVFALREPPRVEIVERVVPAASATPSASPSVFAPVATHALATPEPSASVPTTGSAAAPAKPADSLAAERALLDPARTALGRGDGASALDAVRAHEARFATGKLAEEREAIAVQALVVLHRSDEARARAARFQQRYPGSVLAPSVAAALEVTP